MKEWLKKSIAWIRRMLHLYEKEIKIFVNELLDLAYQNLDNAIIDKLTPAIRKNITNKVLADIIIMEIDIATIQGKTEVSRIMMDAIDWFTKD